jgi:FkbM family methyltransferase
LISTIETTKHINNCNYNIKNKAYSSSEKIVNFSRKSDFFASSLYKSSDKETIPVEAITIEEIISQHDIAKFQLVADIEDAEFDLIESEVDILKEHCSTAIIEFRESVTSKSVNNSHTLLSDNGFSMVESSGDVYVFLRN